MEGSYNDGPFYLGTLNVLMVASLVTFYLGALHILMAITSDLVLGSTACTNGYH